MLPILALAVGLGIFIIFLGIARTPQTNTALMVQQRLQVYGGEKPLTIEEVELQRPFSERFLRPSIEKLGSLLSRSTPEKARQDLKNKLELAGRPGNLTPEDFGAVRIVSAAVLAAVGLLLGFLLANPVDLVISLAVGAILGYYAPVMWLQQKVDARRAEIQKGLPDAMDLLVIAVDAGLGFDDLHNFIQAVIQSEQFGTGIGKILRIQADEMRRKRRQRAQEKAAQATLKMLLPMVGCIFPTLWIVLLGPAALILLAPRK